MKRTISSRRWRSSALTPLLIPPGIALIGRTGRPPKISAASWPHWRHWITCPPISRPTLRMIPMRLRCAGSLRGPMTKSGAARAKKCVVWSVT